MGYIVLLQLVVGGVGLQGSWSPPQPRCHILDSALSRTAACATNAKVVRGQSRPDQLSVSTHQVIKQSLSVDYKLDNSVPHSHSTTTY